MFIQPIATTYVALLAVSRDIAGAHNSQKCHKAATLANSSDT
jgi:hypothetical protein